MTGSANDQITQQTTRGAGVFSSPPSLSLQTRQTSPPFTATHANVSEHNVTFTGSKMGGGVGG